MWLFRRCVDAWWLFACHWLRVPMDHQGQNRTDKLNFHLATLARGLTYSWLLGEYEILRKSKLQACVYSNLVRRNSAANPRGLWTLKNCKDDAPDIQINYHAEKPSPLGHSCLKGGQTFSSESPLSPGNWWRHFGVSKNGSSSEYLHRWRALWRAF